MPGLYDVLFLVFAGRHKHYREGKPTIELGMIARKPNQILYSCSEIYNNYHIHNCCRRINRTLGLDLAILLICFAKDDQLGQVLRQMDG